MQHTHILDRDERKHSQNANTQKPTNRNHRGRFPEENGGWHLSDAPTFPKAAYGPSSETLKKPVAEAGAPPGLAGAAISSSLSYKRNTWASLPESLLVAGGARHAPAYITGRAALRLVIRPMGPLIYRPQRLGVCETSSRPC